MSDLAFLREQLYALKRQYPFEIDLYRVTPGQTDYPSGKKIQVRQKIHIKRAIVLPLRFETVAMYTQAFLKASREFAIGAYQDIDVKRIIIDGADLPKDYEILPDDYIVYDHKRYEITYFEKLEHSAGYLLTAKRLLGAPVNEVHEVKIQQTFRIFQRITI